MLVHRMLDVFFRSLDLVDAARERLDRVRGRKVEPDEAATQWPAQPGEPSTARKSGPPPVEAPPAESARHGGKRLTKVDPSEERTNPVRPAHSSTASSEKKADKQSASRKGSIDRSGKDIDSPRARAIAAHLATAGEGAVSEEAALDGKRVLARVLWALSAAERAGESEGLTTNDASALLHLVAGMDVFATNIARTCRDETALIEESALDGRSKRYRLTAAGKARVGEVATRAL